MSKKKRFFFWTALWFYVLLVVNPFHLQISTLIYMNTTASLPVGIYFAIPGFGVRDGDIVAYEQDEKVMEVIPHLSNMRQSRADTTRLIQKVSCSGSMGS